MPTAGQVTIGVQSSVGKRRFSRTSAQCPHVGAFRFSFYISLIFWAEVPPLLNGGILKRLPNTLENTNVFAGTNVKAWEQTYLPMVAHSAVTSTSLNKSNGKRLCRKISLLRNKYDAMITTIFVFKIATVCNNNSFTHNLCCLLDSEVLWRHLAAVRRHKKGSISCDCIFPQTLTVLCVLKTLKMSMCQSNLDIPFHSQKSPLGYLEN